MSFFGDKVRFTRMRDEDDEMEPLVKFLKAVKKGDEKAAKAAKDGGEKVAKAVNARVQAASEKDPPTLAARREPTLEDAKQSPADMIRFSQLDDEIKAALQTELKKIGSLDELEVFSSNVVEMCESVIAAPILHARRGRRDDKKREVPHIGELDGEFDDQILCARRPAAKDGLCARRQDAKDELWARHPDAKIALWARHHRRTDTSVCAAPIDDAMKAAQERMAKAKAEVADAEKAIDALKQAENKKETETTKLFSELSAVQQSSELLNELLLELHMDSGIAEMENNLEKLVEIQKKIDTITRTIEFNQRFEKELQARIQALIV